MSITSLTHVLQQTFPLTSKRFNLIPPSLLKPFKIPCKKLPCKKTNYSEALMLQQSPRHIHMLQLTHPTEISVITQYFGAQEHYISNQDLLNQHYLKSNNQYHNPNDLYQNKGRSLSPGRSNKLENKIKSCGQSQSYLPLLAMLYKLQKQLLPSALSNLPNLNKLNHAALNLILSSRNVFLCQEPVSFLFQIFTSTIAHRDHLPNCQTTEV